MLKLLVDESSGNHVAAALREKGFDAVYCGKYFQGASDEEIINIANREKRVIVTNDKDFF